MDNSGVTVNGKKPIPSMTIHDYGTRGAAAPSTPNAGQVPAMGAGPGNGGGKFMKPGESTPALNSPAADAERISTGSTAEEQKKRLAARMYPSSNGLGEFGAAGGL